MRNTVTKTWSFKPETALAVTNAAAELGVAESTIVRWAIEKYLNLRTIDVSIGRSTLGTSKRKKSK